jgi:hypothetical protein
MDVSGVLVELFDRVPGLVREAVDDLSPDQLRQAPTEGANPIGWLVWHLARVEDMYGAEYLGQPQVWVGDDWAARFGLEPDPENHGYGHRPADVKKVAPESDQACIDYHAAVHGRLLGYVRGLSSADLDKVIDPSYDPPVTLGVRLISIAEDCLQHGGQAGYVRGCITG